INKFLERSEEPQPELEVSDNVVCKEITANQVKVWPKKGKISSGKLSVKYAILNRIGAANWVPTKHTSDIATGLG
ncbi:envelope-like protein, partial [Trifolium medium]|nr:envelope-like protein [Trifolium medium]